MTLQLFRALRSIQSIYIHSAGSLLPFPIRQICPLWLVRRPPKEWEGQEGIQDSLPTTSKGDRIRHQETGMLIC